MVSRTSLYDWMKNSHLPEDDGPVMEVVYLCMAAAKQRGVPLPEAPQDANGWRRLLAQAKQARDARAASAFRAVERRRGPSGPGMTIDRWSPLALGIHPAIGGTLPEYACRKHDELLRALLDPAVISSRLVVLRGESSTGKTRAAYEAVRQCLPNWLVDYPRTSKILARRLDEGLPPRTVIWLDELGHFTSPDAGVLADLGDALMACDQVIVIATLWPAHWAAYTREHGPELGDLYPDDELPRFKRADSLLGLRSLLKGLPELSRDKDGLEPAFGGIVDVPDRFTDADILEAKRQGGRAILSAIVAAEAAGTRGMVAQYLAGVPDLREHYSGPGANPYGRAVITAAMDAKRLGYAGLLSEELLYQAVIDYLDDSLRVVEQKRWWPSSLEYATRELRGTVNALAPVPPPGGTGIAGYRLADFLDQYGRRIREAAVGPLSLWNALTVNALQGADLSRLGQSAYDRGLYRYAAMLWKRAILAGGIGVVENLLTMLRRVAPESASHAAKWVADYAVVNRPADATLVFNVLRQTKHRADATTLAARAAACVNLDEPDELEGLLVALDEAGKRSAVETLVGRLRCSLPGSVPSSPRLVAVLGRINRRHQIPKELLALRTSSCEARLDTEAIARMVRRPAAITDEAYLLLVNRAADQFPLEQANEVKKLLMAFADAGHREAVVHLAARVADEAPLNDAYNVGGLIKALQDEGCHEAIDRLIARRPEAQVSLGDPFGVAGLLRQFREADHPEAALALGQRFAAHAPMDKPRGLHQVFGELVRSGEQQSVSMFAQRAVACRALRPLATNVVLTWEGVWLIHAFYHGGQKEAALTMAAQVAEEQGPRQPYRFDGVSDVLAIARRLIYEKGGEEVAHAITAPLINGHYVQGPLDNPGLIANKLKWLDRALATEAIEALLARQPALHASLLDPGGVGSLLHTLRRLPGGAGNEARNVLLARRPQEQVSIGSARGLAYLLYELLDSGCEYEAITLLHRIGTELEIIDARGIGALLKVMRAAGAQDTRDLARHAGECAIMTDAAGAAELLELLVMVDEPKTAADAALRAAEQAVLREDKDVSRLLDAVRATGADAALRLLVRRAADSGYYTLLVKRKLVKAYEFGREPDGTASLPWAWHDV